MERLTVEKLISIYKERLVSNTNALVFASGQDKINILQGKCQQLIEIIADLGRANK